MYDGWSSYQTPTLSEVRPNKTKHDNSNLEELVLVDNEELQSAVSDQNEETESIESKPKNEQQNAFTSEWYDRYSYLDSIAKDSGAKSIAGYTSVYTTFNRGMLVMAIEYIMFMSS
jgi:hypothetical protein